MNGAVCNKRTATRFDSTTIADHLTARQSCAVCPAMRDCLQRALDLAAMHDRSNIAHRGPDGTWGGLLWMHGEVQPVYPIPANQHREAAVA